MMSKGQLRNKFIAVSVAALAFAILIFFLLTYRS